MSRGGRGAAEDAEPSGSRRPAPSASAAAKPGGEAGDGEARAIAIGSAVGILAYILLRYAVGAAEGVASLPLVLSIVAGGGLLVIDLAKKALRREFGSDLLAGISIVTAVLLGEHLAGAIVVLMLSGGTALERYAVRRASSVLRALASRVPSRAHRRRDGAIEEIALDAVAVGDALVVFPHEACPVDGTVVDGRSLMDESYLTGEPFAIAKVPGADVISGAVNGEGALTIRATRLAADSRYAKIMTVMRETEQRRPRLRRLADRLGAFYTPVALTIALAAWVASGDPVRFLAVLVIATPCPLLIAIPVAIIGAISLAAKRSIIIKDPAVLEAIETCRTVIFDKTGTLTYGAPALTDEVLAPGVDGATLLHLAASLERYSKHPLAGALLGAAQARGIPLDEATEMSERPGEGLRGKVAGREVLITGRKMLARIDPAAATRLPPAETGLECVIFLDGAYAGLYRFHDAPRAESRAFVGHLGTKHPFKRVLLVSGDRAAEVGHLARAVGIAEVYAGQSPEEKVAIVAAENALAPTLFLGDGINDAPALLAATVGIAFGAKNEVTTEAAGAVIMDTSLERVDELFHLSRRMRRIALQSAVGGMALSVLGMIAAALGLLPPVAGAIGQEAIDLAAVLNALRVALPPRKLSDF